MQTPSPEGTVSNTQFFQQIQKKSDRIFNFSISAYFLNGVLLAFFYDTWLVALGVGGLCLLAYFGSRLILPHSSLYQYVGSGVLAIFMAQFIYQMHGMFEMHFWAYVAAALLITYQNWKLFIPLSLIILLHHAGFAWLQFSGADVYFTQLDYMDLQTFTFHASLAVLIVSICAYWAYDLSQRTIEGGITKLKLQKQLQQVQQNIQFADEISKGNLQIQFQAAEEDELGSALLHMQQNLISAGEREKTERFISQGISRLSDILRNNLNNLQQLSDEVVKEVVSYLELNQAGLFLAEEKEPGDIILTLTSCYAYNRKKFMEKEVAPGQGLVGQAYLEREYIYMTDIPQGYTTITSGLGEATAASILIIPLINNQEIVGILEVASLKEIHQNHILFLQKAAESIASTILSARVNAKTNQLLRQAQEQAEQMRAQEEEMRQNMEEMEATQEEIQRRAKTYDRSMAEKDAEIARLQQQLQLS